MSKIYIDVIAEFTHEGMLYPREIVWADGRKFHIDSVLDVRRAASLRAGGVGTRYLCCIEGKERFLYYEANNLWFVEGPNQREYSEYA